VALASSDDEGLEEISPLEAVAVSESDDSVVDASLLAGVADSVTED